jgi:hypothetical protein
VVAQAHDLALDEVAPNGVGGGLQGVRIVGGAIQGGQGLLDGHPQTPEGAGAFTGQFAFEGGVKAFADAGAGQALGQAEGHAPL